jgi:penicillin amidase/acyl-homoserine-lactone acylase
MIRRIATITVLAAVLIIGGAAIYLWDPLPAHPDRDTLLAAAADYDVEIVRDEWGIPHIVGERDADAAFGLAYAHAEDDFETIQSVVAVVRGVLARYEGASAAPADFLVALLGVWNTIDAHYPNDFSSEAVAVAEAYAAGLNLYAAEHLDETWQGLLPFRGKDIAAGFVFRTPLFYRLDKNIVGLLTGDDARELSLAPAEGEQSFLFGKAGLYHLGSNAFAVAPTRSADQKTRLVVNSHQPFNGAVAWYEARLKSNEGLDIYGGVFPGAPFILHGFNRQLGWANTVNAPDLVDTYKLTVNPENSDQYLLDGDWLDFEKSTATIKVKLWGPLVFSSKQTLLRSRHGPVLETPNGHYALRYAGMDEYRQMDQYLRLNKANSLGQWMDAMRMNALPSINYIYGDAKGNIAFIYNGQYADRKSGWDWTKDLPGDRSDLIWQNYLPFEGAPKLINPQSGFIYNSNNTPFAATDGPDNLRAVDFPAFLGLETQETNRSLRVAELTDGATLLSYDALLRIKFDKSYAASSKAAETVAKILALDFSGEPELTAAAKHLAGWNLGTEVDNRHAAIGVLATIEAVTERLTGDAPPSPEAGFRKAVALLMDNHGRIDPAWGEVNRLRRGDLDIPVGGGPDILRAIYPVEIRNDGRLVANAGDTLIILVEWDAAGDVAAKAIHQYGSATLDAASPHYADQASLFADEKFRDLELDIDALKTSASRTYRPGAP